jgi:hypothetical protein
MSNIDEQPEEGAAKIGGDDPAWPFLRKRLDEKNIQLENSADYLAVLQAMHDYKKSPLPATPSKGVDDIANEYATGMMGIGPYDEKNWHYGDKTMFNTIAKAVKYGLSLNLAGASSAAPVVGDLSPESILEILIANKVEPNKGCAFGYTFGTLKEIAVLISQKTSAIPSTLIADLEAANPHTGEINFSEDKRIGWDQCIAKLKELINKK